MKKIAILLSVVTALGIGAARADECDHAYEISNLYSRLHELKGIENRIDHPSKDEFCEDVEMKLFADCAAYQYAFTFHSVAERAFVRGYVEKEIKRIQENIEALRKDDPK